MRETVAIETPARAATVASETCAVEVVSRMIPDVSPGRRCWQAAPRESAVDNLGKRLPNREKAPPQGVRAPEGWKRDDQELLDCGCRHRGQPVGDHGRSGPDHVADGVVFRRQ